MTDKECKLTFFFKALIVSYITYDRIYVSYRYAKKTPDDDGFAT